MSARISRRGAIAGAVAPVTYTFYSDPADGRIYGANGTYLTARSTATAADQVASTSCTSIGQYYNGTTTYQCSEMFLSFDTSSIPDAATITSAVLSIYGATDNSATEFNIEARLHDWGATLELADWVAGADLGAKTLLATQSTTFFSTVAYMDMADVALAANVNKAGATRIVLASERQRLATAPTGEEYVELWAGDEGANKRPKLVVVAA